VMLEGGATKLVPVGAITQEAVANAEDVARCPGLQYVPYTAQADEPHLELLQLQLPIMQLLQRSDLPIADNELQAAFASCGRGSSLNARRRIVPRSCGRFLLPRDVLCVRCRARQAPQ
jgi:hypothetical protein